MKSINTNKTFKLVVWVTISCILLIILAVYFNHSSKILNINRAKLIACTDEAKLCPDGSYVARTGPMCEFTACPTESNIKLWKTITDSKTGVTFQYPEKLLTEYISTVDWPPIVQIIDQPFTCTESGSEITSAGKTVKETINGQSFCITKESEGAAGSIYTKYTYSFPKDKSIAIITFTLRFVQCANYDEPKKTACEKEQPTFNIDDIVVQMAKSLHIEHV